MSAGILFSIRCPTGERYGEKEKRLAICVQFNEQDPHHQQVMDILNAQGRHKAQFIAAAILHYINCSERPVVLQDVAGLRKVIEMIVLEALEKHGGVSAKEKLPPTEKRLQGKTGRRYFQRNSRFPCSLPLHKKLTIPLSIKKSRGDFFVLMYFLYLFEEPLALYIDERHF